MKSSKSACSEKRNVNGKFLTFHAALIRRADLRRRKRWWAHPVIREIPNENIYSFLNRRLPCRCNVLLDDYRQISCKSVAQINPFNLPWKARQMLGLSWRSGNLVLSTAKSRKADASNSFKPFVRAIRGIVGFVWLYLQKMELRYWWEYGEEKTITNLLNEKRSLIRWWSRVSIWKINFCSRVLQLSELPRCRERPKTAICCFRSLSNGLLAA